MADTLIEPVTQTIPEKPQSAYERPEELMQRYNISLTNAKNSPDVLAVMKVYNYDEQRISEGLALHQKVTTLITAQRKEKGEQLQASKELNEHFEAARDRFLTTRTIAKNAFENDPNAFMALGLSGRTKTTISGLTKQASPFYSNILANPVFSSRMEHFGFTAAKLTEEKDLIQIVLDADAHHKKEFGEALEARNSRDSAFEELDTWMSTFYTVAKEALKRKPELMKQLGM